MTLPIELPIDRINAMIDLLYQDSPGRAAQLKQHIETLTDEIGRARAALLLHAQTEGYVLMWLPPGHEWPQIWGEEIYPDMGYALDAKDAEAREYRGLLTVMALMPLQLFEDKQ